METVHPRVRQEEEGLPSATGSAPANVVPANTGTVDIVKVCVCDLAGKELLDAAFESEKSVLDVKLELEKITGMLRFFMNLIIDERELVDKDSLSSVLVSCSKERVGRIDITFLLRRADHEEWLPKISENPRACVVTAPDIVRADHVLILHAINECKPWFNFSPLACAVPEIVDRELVTAAVQCNGWQSLEWAQGFQGDRDIVKSALRQTNGWRALQWTTDDIRNDRELMLFALDPHSVGSRKTPPWRTFGRHQHEHPLRWASKELLADRDFALSALELHGSVFAYLHTSLQADSAIARAAVHSKTDPTTWLEILDACKALYSDLDVMKEALSQDGRALEFSPTEIKSNKELCIAALGSFGYALRWVAPPLREDPDVCKAAVQQDGHALRWAGPTQQADSHIALLAVQQDASALQLVPETFVCDREIVSTSVRADGYSLRWASPELRADSRIVLEAVSRNGLALQWASPELQAQRAVVQAAVSSEGCALRYASAALRGDRDIVRQAVAQDGWAIRWASEDLKADYHIAYEALQLDDRALAFVSPEVENRDELVALAEQTLQRIIDDETDTGYTPRRSDLVGWTWDYMPSFHHNDSCVHNF